MSPLPASTPAPSSSPGEGAVPTFVPAPAGERLIVMAEGGSILADYTTGSTAGSSLSLLTMSGQQVGTIPLKSGLTILAAAGDRIFVKNQQNELKAIHRDGTVDDIGAMGDTCTQRLVASPDGTRWLWGSITQGSNPIQSQIHEGGVNMTAKVIATSNSTVLTPGLWNASGAFLQTAPCGVGGYGVFPPGSGPVQKVDPDRGTVTPITGADRCNLAAAAGDGTLGCVMPFNGPAPSEKLVIVLPSGTRTSVALPQAQFKETGEAAFSPTGDRLAVAGAADAGNPFSGNPQPEQYTVYMAGRNGTASPFGPPGVRLALGPNSWLQDGHLMLWRPNGAAGGQPGLYVVDQNGKGALIPDNGVPIGVLS